jgi:hypothetical protein
LGSTWPFRTCSPFSRIISTTKRWER